MKSTLLVFTRTLALLAFSLSVVLCHGQFLSFHDTIAHYSMINTAEDHTGNHADIEFQNTPYADTNGVYCNGLYIHDVQPGGSALGTDNLEELYHPAFAAGIDFKLDTQVTRTAPIIVMGASWRYLGIVALTDSTITCLFNGAEYAVENYEITPDEWHRATVMYTEVDSTAQFWIDGRLLMTRTGALNRSDGDGQVSNTHYGNGLTFKGHMRNLTVYSSEDQLSSVDDIIKYQPLQIFPNPATDVLNLPSGLDLDWSIYTSSGILAAKGSVRGRNTIAISDLPGGTYILKAIDSNSSEVYVQKFIKLALD